MNWVDVAIIVVVALSALIGFARGFLREAVGLAAWIVALYLAFTFARPAAVWLQDYIATESIRVSVAFGSIFVAVLLVGAVINYGVGRLVSSTGFAGTDRALGIGFGILRGIALLVLLVLLAGLTQIPRDDWWQQSIFIDRLEQGALWARDYLPDDLAQAVSYPEAGDTPDTSEAPEAPSDPKPATI